jgi:hypothetical protein
MTTKGDTISNVRNLVKATKLDAFVTDRFLYNLVLTQAKLFIQRKDDQNKLGLYSSLFQNLPGVVLEETSRIEAGCIDIASGCTFKRTKDPLPKLMEGSYGEIIRSITSIDGSREVRKTNSRTYMNMRKSSSFKYNNYVYYWLRNGYAYFPDLEWDVVDIEGMWQDDIAEYRCDAENCCTDRREERSNIPDGMFAEIEEMVRQKLLNTVQIPKDNMIDNQSQFR